MRYRYFINAMTFVVLFVFDFIFQSLFNSFNLQQVFFVSQLHFIGLILFAREDSRIEITTKVILVSFVMDLFHYKSFPIYYIAYGISIMFIRFWHRHIGDSMIETMLIIAIGIFIKEFLLFKSLEMHIGLSTNFIHFFSERSFWIILISTIFFKIPSKIIEFGESIVKNYSARHYQ